MSYILLRAYHRSSISTKTQCTQHPATNATPINVSYVHKSPRISFRVRAEQAVDNLALQLFFWPGIRLGCFIRGSASVFIAAAEPCPLITLP